MSGGLIPEGVRDDARVNINGDGMYTFGEMLVPLNGEISENRDKSPNFVTSDLKFSFMLRDDFVASSMLRDTRYFSGISPPVSNDDGKRKSTGSDVLGENCET